MPRPPIPNAPPDRTDPTLEHLPSIVVEGDDEHTSAGGDLPFADQPAAEKPDRKSTRLNSSHRH